MKRKDDDEKFTVYSKSETPISSGRVRLCIVLEALYLQKIANHSLNKKETLQWKCFWLISEKNTYSKESIYGFVKEIWNHSQRKCHGFAKLQSTNANNDSGKPLYKQKA